MIVPVCSRCSFLTNDNETFRKCPRIPIFHRDMCCSNVNNMITDHVSGESYKPFCEEVNRHGECLEYYPVGLIEPSLFFEDGVNVLTVKGTNPIVITYDGSTPSKENKVDCNFDEELKLFVYETKVDHTCTVKAACIIDEVISPATVLDIEITDVPTIEFDKSTNTVTINSYNKVYFTTDGSKVTEDSDIYTEPFIIDHNTTIKCCSYALNDLSPEVSLYCVSIEPPVIEFDSSTNKVTITADDTILYSLDGSDIYTDSTVYDEPIELSQNTIVKSACLVDGELSEQVELECKVANPPIIVYDEKTHKVTIEAENKILYTIDGSTPKHSSTEYTSPFTIKETVTVKAVSETDILSDVSELECIFVSAPEITFNSEDNIVTISGDNKILYSTDGSKIYDDSDEYTDPFYIEKNTTVRAACILNDILSEEVSLVCKVPSIPTISFDSRTKTVTITSDNPVLYTTDGSDVKKKDTEYKSPFKITTTSTIKAKSIVNDKLSEQAELECVI